MKDLELDRELAVAIDVFWLEQVRSTEPAAAFERARPEDSEEMPLPSSG